MAGHTPETVQGNNVQEYLLDKKLSFRLIGYRWLGLTFCCIVMMGSYFCFDNPSALQTKFTDKGGLYRISGTQVNLLYSVYSFPNIILPFFGGILVDKIGVRVAILLFSGLLILGQLIFTYGVYEISFTWMIVGRVVFGFGGESLTVAQSAIVSQWFKGKELALALGLNISVARLGSSLNSMLSPLMVSSGPAPNLWIPCFVGIIFCIISFLFGVVLCWMDKEADKREGIIDGAGTSEPEKIDFKDLKNFKLLYWLLLTSCFLIYGSYFGFTNDGNDLIHEIFGFENDSAGFLLSTVYIIAAILTPAVGFMIDRIGQRAILMIIASCILITAHAILILCPIYSDGNYIALIPLGLIGIFYSLYAAVFWPCVPLVVEEKAVGTAFGVITAVQNIMLSINPIVLGAVHDNTEEERGGYLWYEVIIGAFACIGLLNSLLIYIEDRKTGNNLQKIHTDNVNSSVKSKSFSASIRR